MADKQAQHAKIQEASVIGAMILGMGLGIAVFQGLPNFISAGVGDKFHLRDWQINLITELLKITFFLGYVGLIGLMPEIKRVFQYHGAEHKAINVLEAEQELSMDHALAQTRLHPRCGTSFAIIVLLVSLVVFTFVPRPQGMPWALGGFVRFLIEIPLLFFIAGISYELLRFAGKNRDSAIVKALFMPGLMSQYLTTREPDESQIEVALVALKECMKAEEGTEPGADPIVIPKTA